MTSYSAQKAAELWVLGHEPSAVASLASIIQQAITEAVDAAVEQRKQRELEVAAHWRSGPIGLTEGARKLYVDYRATCVIELEALAKEK